jgi:hypothetical protein
MFIGNANKNKLRNQLTPNSTIFLIGLGKHGHSTALFFGIKTGPLS